jgi:hypothetical protein
MTWFVGGQRLDVQAGQVDEYQLGNTRISALKVATHYPKVVFASPIKLKD